MRAVALSDKNVQGKIEEHFVPLKVVVTPGTEELPLKWPAVDHWRSSYRLMGGKKCEGFTCCSTVSPDLQVEYGNTGSAFVWEMFDSIAYDADKFVAMLERSLQRAEEEQAIRNNPDLGEFQRSIQMALHRRTMKREIGREGRFRLPPKGFSIEGAKRLFEMTGDLPK